MTIAAAGGHHGRIDVGDVVALESADRSLRRSSFLPNVRNWLVDWRKVPLLI
jgi:hypothetical protein